MKKTVSNYAFEDISEYYSEEIKKGIVRDGGLVDVFFVSPHWLDNKEQRKLNKLLGLSGINKIGNTNMNTKNKQNEKN